MASWYIGSVQWTAVTAWAAATSYSIGDIRRQLAAPTIGNERVWRCTTAGTSLASEPTWTLTKGSTTTEAAGPVWTEITGNSTYNWTAPHARLASCLSWAAAGDMVYISDDSAETQTGAMTNTSPGTLTSPCYIYCVNHAGSVPPVSADLRTTATIATTGANNIQWGGFAFVYGIETKIGSSSTSASLSMPTSPCGFTFKNCKFTLNNTNAASLLGFTGNAASSFCILDNTVLTFGNASQVLKTTQLRFTWRNTASALGGATFPTALLQNSAATVLFEGLDLSALGSGATIVGQISGFGATGLTQLKDCRLGASVTIATTPAYPGSAETLVSRCDSTGTNYTEMKVSYMATQTDETVIIRTGGASDGTTAKSRKIVTTANNWWHAPFEATPIAIWNDSTSAATATLEFVWNAAALPNNDELWFDLEYLGASGNPKGSFVTGTKADGLATGAALTASTQAWDSLVTARANSTAYSVGDVRKVATNSGRIFFCTTAGTSAGSEPGGYASAVDGGSVTDGSAVFRAGMRAKQTLSFTAGQKGAVYAYVKAAKVSSTWWVDPLITLA